MSRIISQPSPPSWEELPEGRVLGGRGSLGTGAQRCRRRRRCKIWAQRILVCFSIFPGDAPFPPPLPTLPSWRVWRAGLEGNAAGFETRGYGCVRLLQIYLRPVTSMGNPRPAGRVRWGMRGLQRAPPWRRPVERRICRHLFVPLDFAASQKTLA